MNPNQNQPEAVVVETPQKLTNIWSEIAFWSLIPATVIVPAWLTFGRIFFGAGGWFIIIMLFSVAPIAFLYHVAIEVLAWFGPKRQALSRLACLLLAIYYVAALIFGLSLIDGGDTSESVQSVLTIWGIPSVVSSALAFLSGVVLVASAIALLVVLIIDITKARKNKHAA